MMYKEVNTLCWSIKQVNKNLSDRKALADYSVSYLKAACEELSRMTLELASSLPKEAINVVDKGKKKKIALAEAAEMLHDPKKIIELNLIDSIESWAKAQLK
jgi:ABC-type Na+ transport system ATPase subunit NatA